MNILNKSTENHLIIEDEYLKRAKQEDYQTIKNGNISIGKRKESTDQEEESSFCFVLGYN